MNHEPRSLVERSLNRITPPPGLALDLEGKRVEIPAHTDAWMRGDRFGEIVATTARPQRTPGGFAGIKCCARVRLDKSGRTVKVDLDQLRFVD